MSQSKQPQMDFTALLAALNQAAAGETEPDPEEAGENLEPEEPESPKSVFAVLSAVNVNDHVERKNGMAYLSWAWAWGTLKKLYPEATYQIYEDSSGFLYHTDGRTAWVKVGVTVEGIENIEYLPVMDYRNRSIPLEKMTSFDANKAIQRALVKAIARHGLGLYLYAGEDLPESEKPAPTVREDKPAEPYRSKETIRKECIALYEEQGRDAKDLAADFGVNPGTTKQQWEEVLHELQKSQPAPAAK